MATKDLLSEIQSGAELKSAETQDKSAPVIDPSVEIKPSKRPDLLAEVTKGAELKHVETVDKAAPKIEADVKIKPSNRPNLLAEIKSKGGD